MDRMTFPETMIRPSA